MISSAVDNYLVSVANEMNAIFLFIPHLLNGDDDVNVTFLHHTSIGRNDTQKTVRL